MNEHLSMDQVFINKLTEIVNANLSDEKFNVEELIKESGISSSTIHRKLRSITNKSVSQFIREIRLQRAREMLRNNEGTAAEVAFMTGFGSPTYFTKCFHEFFGYPPGKAKDYVSDGMEEIQASSDNLKQKRQRIQRKIIVFIPGISLALFLLIYVVDTSHKASPERTLAVLPFRNISNDSTDQIVYDGFMEEIINALGKVKELKVISGTSVEQYRNTARPTREIGKDLNVNYIVEGSGQKIGSKSILRVRLIEVPADKLIWRDSYDVEFTGTAELFGQINRIAQSIVSELGATITSDEKELMERVPTQDSTAYRLYQKATTFERDYEKSRDLSSYQTAVNLYNVALEFDSAFARAYTGLAFAYWSRYYAETFFKEGFLDSCRILADKALSFDDKLDEAYYIKGRYFREKGEIEVALKNFDRALEINPNYSLAYIYRGTMLAYILYDYVNSLENFHKALDLTRGKDRISMLNNLVFLYGNCGFLEKAKYYLEEATKLSGDSARYLYHLGWMEFFQENFEEAFKLLTSANQIDSSIFVDQFIYIIAPGHPKEAYANAIKKLEYYKRPGRITLELGHIGYTFWLAGKYEEAEFYFNQHIKNMEEIIRLNREGGQKKFAQYDLACIYAHKGDKAKAFTYLEEYSNRSFSRLVELSLTKNDPMFANIRSDDRFKNLVKKMETSYQKEHDRVKEWLKDQGMSPF